MDYNDIEKKLDDILYQTEILIKCIPPEDDENFSYDDGLYQLQMINGSIPEATENSSDNDPNYKKETIGHNEIKQTREYIINVSAEIMQSADSECSSEIIEKRLKIKEKLEKIIENYDRILVYLKKEATGTKPKESSGHN